MTIIPFDTHEFVKELESAGFSAAQAEAQAAAISKALKQAEESRINNLATKHDRAETKVEIIKWVAGMLIVQAGILIGGFFSIVRYLLK